MGKIRKVVTNVGETVKKNPAIVTSTATLGVSSAGFIANRKDSKRRRETSDRQAEVLNKLARTLDKVDTTIKKTNTDNQTIRESSPTFKKRLSRLFSKDNRNMKKFKQKDFGKILSRTLSGAKVGALVGGGLAAYAPDTMDSKKVPSKFRNKYNSGSTPIKKISIVAGSTLIGAALGGLYGILEKGSDLLSRGSVDKRLMAKVIENLKKTGFKEGVDFTLDPKQATSLRTRVCIVTTRVSGELKVLINTQSEQKLQDLTDNITENLKNSSLRKEKGSNRYNEITVSTISDGSADAGLIVGICEQYIRNGYPVYLVEVGN